MVQSARRPENRKKASTYSKTQNHQHKASKFLRYKGRIGFLLGKVKQIESEDD